MKKEDFLNIFVVDNGPLVWWRIDHVGCALWDWSEKYAGPPPTIDQLTVPRSQ